MPGLESLMADAQRVLTICDSCRYCEGYCPVFPALERGSLADGDMLRLPTTFFINADCVIDELALPATPEPSQRAAE